MAEHEPLHVEDVALARYELILPTLDDTLSNKDRLKRMRYTSNNGGPSVRTLKRYYQSYKDGGFEALKPKIRKDEFSKVIRPEVLSAAIILRRENPSRSIKDIIFILENRGDVEKDEVKRSTLQHYFQNQGFSKKQMGKYIQSKGVATRRYRKQHRMEQLQSDFKYACFLPLGQNGKYIQVYWTAWVDNSSRMILDGKFYTRQTFYEVEDSLRRVIEKYGKPVGIYLDNGKPFVSKKLKLIGSKLNINICHARIYSPEGKGLIERINRTLDKFLSEAALEGYGSIEELNINYDAWISEYYNNSLHSSIREGTPKQAFRNDSRPLNFISSKQIEDAFSTRVTRKVNKDCTISIDGKYYDVHNINLIGLEIEAIYDPREMDEILIRKIGFEDEIANPVTIGSFVSKPKKVYTDGRSKIETTHSEELKAIRLNYAKENPNYNFELASKAERENKQRNNNQEVVIKFHSSKMEVEND